MPRDGSGASDNKVEESHDVIHGAGAIKDPHVDRADKTAPLPEPEKGLAIDGLAASGGQSVKGDGIPPGERST
ncbi:hypothetical protein CaCOL14_012677 [Colletotrichum acutatum]|uniref:Uncharacterized protein n=1 Tax=Glomerella acutata TaxID=27357 RepID=A0AAD8XCC6_GLOAC|nr:uncharacterized protein BDZ83DRAFT_754742 [Colletotrichum acutatum]KAK1721281.1 hypothetical protein BDZ83DRAFT_754742 [Colletotrichum acutatum]